jgi:hypothetical protein
MRCRRCLLPAQVPGSDIDQSGICAFCRAYRRGDEAEGERARQDRERDLERALDDARRAPGYHALVCVSGGKDSLALLHRVKVRYGLNVLAYTVDANIPELAWRNIRTTVARLGVDHLVYRPPAAFYRKLFAHLLRHQEPRGAVYTVSYVYAPLFEGDALALATQKGIPLVLAGYSPGQPEPDRMVYEFPRALVERTDWTPPALRESGAFDAAELGRFWNPARWPAGTRFPRYLAPFHAWDYDQDAVVDEVASLGLVARKAHASPVVTNYPVNWLLMYSDLMHFGYNPYAPEFCALIRRGKASRGYWRVAAPVVDLMIRRRVLLGRNVTQQLRELELHESDLRIDQPPGAYDPTPPAT